MAKKSNASLSADLKKDRTTLNQQIGTAIKNARLEEGHGLREFAEDAGIAPANLSAIEHGRRTFSFPALLKLARMLGRRVVVTLEKRR